MLLFVKEKAKMCLYICIDVSARMWPLRKKNGCLEGKEYFEIYFM